MTPPMSTTLVNLTVAPAYWDNTQGMLDFPLFTVTILVWIILGVGLKFFSSVPLFDSRHARYVEAFHGFCDEKKWLNGWCFGQKKHLSHLRFIPGTFFHQGLYVIGQDTCQVCICMKSVSLKTSFGPHDSQHPSLVVWCFFNPTDSFGRRGQNEWSWEAKPKWAPTYTTWNLTSLGAELRWQSWDIGLF